MSDPPDPTTNTYDHVGVITSVQRCWSWTAEQDSYSAPNAKRVYPVMKLRGLLLQPHAGVGAKRRHEGGAAVPTRSMR